MKKRWIVDILLVVLLTVLMLALTICVGAFMFCTGLTLGKFIIFVLASIFAWIIWGIIVDEVRCTYKWCNLERWNY